MEEQQLLVQLAKTAREANREEQQLDPRWDELVAGTLSATEVEALRTDSERRLGGEETEELFALFTPLGAQFQHQVVHSIQERRRFTTHPQSEETDRRASVASPPPAKPSHDWRRVSGWAAAAVVVVAAGLALLRGGNDFVPLPEYSSTLAGGVAEQRGPADGGDATAHRFVTGNRFELILRPATTVADAVEVRTLLAYRGELRPWPVATQIAPSGAVSIAGRVPDQIPLPVGQSELWVVVAPVGEVPTNDRLLGELRRLLSGRQPQIEEPVCRSLTPTLSICQLSVLFEE